MPQCRWNEGRLRALRRRNASLRVNAKRRAA
jgi:hypothetical protein